MRTTSVLSAAALCLVSACADNIPVEPTAAALSAYSARASTTTDAQVTIVDPSIAEIGADLELPEIEGDVMLASLELLYDHHAAHAAPATLILANDRLRLTPAQWVPNDPRRGGHSGLKWGYLAFNPVGVGYFDPATRTVRAAQPVELEARIVEAMTAWDERQCSRAPLPRLFPGSPGVPDVIHVGWLDRRRFSLFNNFGILGVTRTFIYINPNGTPTDIDGNGRPDLARAEILYNAHRVWSDNGPLGTIDLFSVLAHESGHAFGLNHFGKVFVSRKDVTYTPTGTPSFRLEAIKYAPKALMNAVYVTGRSEIAGIDNSMFCQVWANER